MYLVSATPLAKIFQPRYHAELRADPSKIYEKKKFDIIIPRCNGDFKFTYAQPKLFQKKPKEYEDDFQGALNWLTGGKTGEECSESDLYGVVELPAELDVMGMLSGIIGANSGDEEEEKRVKKVEKSILPALKTAMQEAEAMSEARVMRAIRQVYKNLKSQYDRNKESKLGEYMPSTTEFLCIYALSSELKAAGEKETALISTFAKHMDEIRLN